jgi:hypothetical protein
MSYSPLFKGKGYRVGHLLETHVNADYLTASHSLQQQLGDTADKRPKTEDQRHAGIVRWEVW